MARQPELWYDANCPICKMLADAVRERTSVKLVGSELRISEPRYIDREGTVHVGSKAVARLGKDFPALTEGLDFLPENWKAPLMQAGYQGAKLARSIIKKAGGCGCGK